MTKRAVEGFAKAAQTLPAYSDRTPIPWYSLALFLKIVVDNSALD